LGIIFDEHLNWKHHISNICTKANAAKSFLRRNIIHCPKNIKANCYKSFVRPILEYSSSVWSPHLQTDIQQIEKIQRSAARYVLNDYSWHSSVTSMLSNLGWSTLEERRSYNKLVTFFKLIQSIIEIPTLQPTPLTSVIRGHSQRFRIPQARTNLYLHSFLPSTIKLWNNLPNHLVEVSSLNSFKEQLTNYLEL